MHVCFEKVLYLVSSFILTDCLCFEYFVVSSLQNIPVLCARAFYESVRTTILISCISHSDIMTFKFLFGSLALPNATSSTSRVV